MSRAEHLEVTVDVDCGNAPRKAQVRDWVVALAAGDVDAVCNELDTGVRWDVAGQRRYEGIDEVRRYVEQLADEEITSLSIRHVLSHGKQVVAEGATDTTRFIHLVTYTGHSKTASIAEVITYLTPGSA